jgi:hypothetical protein
VLAVALNGMYSCHLSNGPAGVDAVRCAFLQLVPAVTAARDAVLGRGGWPSGGGGWGGGMPAGGRGCCAFNCGCFDQICGLDLASSTRRLAKGLTCSLPGYGLQWESLG